MSHLEEKLAVALGNGAGMNLTPKEVVEIARSLGTYRRNGEKPKPVPRIDDEVFAE